MKRNKWITLVLAIVFLTGLSLVLYPSFSDYWNQSRQSHAISQYVEQLNSLDTEQLNEQIEEAREFNAHLLERVNPFVLTDELLLRYNMVLDTTGTGIMAYVEIPSINVMLPVYHGTDEAVLQTAVGHLEWSSLPVGGESTHTVISGHRGLPRAKLFTDLDMLQEGDIFLLQVLDETLTYEVDQILIVEPEVIKDLTIEPGKDYCTLVTCTPYGVNTHRLLVRGHRIENLEQEKQVRIVSEASRIEPLIVAPIVSIPLLLLLLLIYMLDDAIWGNKEDYLM